jgi:hypothetical protein
MPLLFATLVSSSSEHHPGGYVDANEEEIKSSQIWQGGREDRCSAMRRKKHGNLRSGKRGKGGKVKSRKQTIAIGISEARKKGAKVPRSHRSVAMRRLP